MSWSVHAAGKVAAVKAALATQFANAKNGAAGIPHEVESVGLIEQVVNGQLDFLGEASKDHIVEVKAGGSAWKADQADGTKSRSSSVTMEVKVLSGFVE